MEAEWNGYRLTDNELQALLAYTGGTLVGLQIGTGDVTELKEGLLLLQEKGFFFHAEDGEMLEKVISFVIYELGNADQCLLFEAENECTAGLYSCAHMWIFLAKRRGVWQLFPLPSLEEAWTVFQQYQAGVNGLFYLYSDDQVRVLDSREQYQIKDILQSWVTRREE